MFIYICLLAFIGLGSCLEIEKVMPSRYEIESSINRTIDEVEKLIQEDSSLPRLNRNDIVDILHKITSKHIVQIEDKTLEAIENTRADYQRALMVVLPHKPKDSEESLRELYTKPPIIQMVTDEPRPRVKDSIIETTHNPNPYNKHQLTSAHVTFHADSSNNDKVEMAPHKFSFNLENYDQKPEASHSSVGTRRPIMKGTFSRYRINTQKPKITTTTTTSKPSTTTTDKIETTMSTPIKPVQNVLSSDQWHYYAPPIKSQKVEPDNSSWKPMSPSKGFFLPTIQSTSEELEVPDSTVLKLEKYEKVKEITTSTTARPSPIFVTPSVETKHKNVQHKGKPIPFESKLTTTTTTPTVKSVPIRQEVEQLLNAIGLHPIKLQNQQNEFKFNHNTVDALLNAHFDNKIKDPKFGPVKSDLTTVENNSFNAPIPIVKDGVKNLSPDIQLLFKQFGLQISGQELIKTTTTTTPRPTLPTNVDLYTHFKPLPTSSVKDKDFLNFLSRFGLGAGENRNQKSLQSQQVTKVPSLIDAVPDNMKRILENIGLIKKAPKISSESESRSQKKTKVQTEAPKIIQVTTPVNEHIFKPYEIEVNDKEQNEKIKNLLNTVRMVQEGRANVQDVQRVAHDLLKSTKSLANGPDPLKLEEILNNYRDNLKNEVKRQENRTTTTTTTTTTTAATTTEELDESSNSSTKAKQGQKTDQTVAEQNAKPSFFDTFDAEAFLNQTSSSTTTTVKPPGGSFFDNFDIEAALKNETEAAKNSGAEGTGGVLEDSFGGSTAEPDPVIPTRPKTGIYFLVDWNTFLEVGEDGKEKVNLRFEPKVGDRTRFVSVKIP